MTFGTDTRGAQKMNPNEFDDLTFSSSATRG